MKKLHYTLLAAALLAAGCAEEVTNHASSASKFITFNVTNGDATSWNSDFEPGTRSEVVEKATPQQTMEQFKSESPLEEPICLFTTVEDNDSWGVDSVPRYLTRGAEVTSFTTFGWFAYIGSTEVYGNSSVTKGTTDFKTNEYWPADAVSGTKTYDFYAYYPYLSGTTNGLTLDQTAKKIIYDATAATAANQQDLMVANVSRDYSNGSNLDLSFVHACTQVIIKTGNNFDTRGGKVKKIIFENIVTSGNCAINSTTPTWSSTSSTASWTVYDDATGVGDNNKNILSGGTALMMIPQEFTNDNQVIKVVITDKTGTENTLSLTLNGTSWVRAKRVTYTISTSAITSFEVTYPTWDDGSESGIYGPVENYETGESFGLFAVDKAGKIVIANAQIKVTEASGHKGTCKLTGSTTEEAFNESSLANVIPSQNYTYYLYYPYTTTNTQINALSAGTAAPGGGSGTADTFFANVISGWTPSSTQDTQALFKAQDLQVAKYNSGFAMEHQMGLLHIVMPQQSAYKTRYKYISAGNWVDNTTKINNAANSTTRDAAIDFTSSTWKPWAPSRTSCYLIGKPSDNTLPIAANRTGSEDYESYYTWSVTDQKTTTGGTYTYKQLSIANNVYLKEAWEFGYEGAGRSFAIPATGTYRFECWGAQGGDATRVYNYGPDTKGGKGGYGAGTFTFTATPTVYVYVGQQGGLDDTSTSRTFNGGGGGYGTEATPTGGTRGGGATDVRLAIASGSDGWSGDNSLKTRLIIGGGGGGTSYWFTETNKEDIVGSATGGGGGGLTGCSGHVGYRISGYTAQTVSDNLVSPTGGTQTSGGQPAYWDGAIMSEGADYEGVAGIYGMGASAREKGMYQGSGGGGHYGGATASSRSGLVCTGAGGSGFVSGASGCVAISGFWDSSDHSQVRYNSVSYKFTNTSLINGETSLPKSSGLYKDTYESSDKETGHSGHGFARIVRFQILNY